MSDSNVLGRVQSPAAVRQTRLQILCLPDTHAFESQNPIRSSRAGLIERLERHLRRPKRIPKTEFRRDQSIKSIFYFMSVHIEVILDKNKKQKHIIIIYTNFPTGL